MVTVPREAVNCRVKGCPAFAALRRGKQVSGELTAKNAKSAKASGGIDIFALLCVLCVSALKSGKSQSEEERTSWKHLSCILCISWLLHPDRHFEMRSLAVQSNKFAVIRVIRVSFGCPAFAALRRGKQVSGEGVSSFWLGSRPHRRRIGKSLFTNMATSFLKASTRRVWRPSRTKG
jgi:hypothetical protein